MWRDLGQYVQALRKQWLGLITGPTASFLLLVWQVFRHTDIPTWVFWVVTVAGIPVAGFLAWCEEHAKVTGPREVLDPEMELSRPQFEKEIATLSPDQRALLRYLARVGDANAMQARDNSFPQQGKTGGAQDAEQLLLGIAATGLLEPKERGTAFPRYAIKPVWRKLVVEWAAPPTVVDARIADKARQLRRTLAASFEDWPAGLKKLDDLTTWAAKVLRGFPETEKALREIVELRPEASRRVDQAVGAARDAYYAAADVITRLFRVGGLSINDDNRNTVETQLRRAMAQVEQCLAELDKVTRD